jgi:hypothetical protein
METFVETTGLDNRAGLAYERRGLARRSRVKLASVRGERDTVALRGVCG